MKHKTETKHTVNTRFQDDPVYPYLRLAESIFLQASLDALHHGSTEGMNYVASFGKDTADAQDRFNRRTGRHSGIINYNYIIREIKKRRSNG